MSDALHGFSRLASRAALAGTLVFAAAPGAHAATVCNGRAELCGRRYDEVTFPSTHNSHANTTEGYTINASQSQTITQQLEGGVRGLELDFWEYDGEIALCHGVCVLANKPAVEGLAEIKTFLDAHPQEVVTIYLDSFVTADQAGSVFEAAGLLDSASPSSDYLYAHPGGEWPTLGELIDAGERLLVFSNDDEETTHPWYMFKFRHGFDTTWDTYQLSDLDCAIDGGSATNALFWLNHRLETLVGGGTTALAAQANTNPFLLDKARECAALYGKTPNFVHVDFYEVGDLLDTVDALNGFPVACHDADGDGYGSPASPDCPAGFELDCDDTNGAVYPGATELPGNGIDDDCDPATPGACVGPQVQAAVGDGRGMRGGSPSIDLGMYLVPAAAFVLAIRRRAARGTAR
ncbi:MAG: phosphatidylinositol-specific phospholipase C domain-containing protein [bacterium]